MTNVWMDIKNADVITIMGGNAAEAHPCGFKWVTEAKAHNKAKLIVVDPRFTRSASVADLYVPIRQGSDIAWLNGLINYIVTNDKTHKEYVATYTNAAFILKEGFGFDDGLSPASVPRKRITTAPAGITSSTSRASPRSTRPCRTRAASTR